MLWRVSYENGEKAITANSNNGEKIFAPGTENSYTFKLKNTGDVALDYAVAVDVFFTPRDIVIPITGRLSRYDGKWIAGGLESYVEIQALDAAEDRDSLGAGKYTYYTLDWLWPFESGNDELDTWLGNLAVEQDLSLTIVITTTATDSADPNDGSGITPPQTGDESNMIPWILASFCSLLMMIFLIRCAAKETLCPERGVRK